ncbi:hypothetical protein EDD29_0922 [Actinocorallia herbida]|uniref:DivIVA domain-containing protein n=1 Tax=Actinocorallia herbida TaxID=58109 RepID=A0A3N1CQ33_9ACTN|nr:hypothetical protein [Actinocorallia herbida]ROO83419.1 hypothetical protein EDD29_0922 [Actinocorallia herbida]
MARFPRALRGYFASEVDALIVRIEGALGVHEEPVPPITAAELRETRLGVVLHGYDRLAVDAALLEYVRQLEHRERGDADPYTETVSGQVPWLVRWVSEAEFPVTRVRAAYRERDVDAFLDRVLAGLRGEGPAVSGRAVREAVFGGVFWRAGYAEPAVDRFLNELAAALDHLQQVPAGPDGRDGAAPADGPGEAGEHPVAESAEGDDSMTAGETAETVSPGEGADGADGESPLAAEADGETANADTDTEADAEPVADEEPAEEPDVFAGAGGAEGGSARS